MICGTFHKAVLLNTQQNCKAFLVVTSTHFRYHPLLPDNSFIAVTLYFKYLLNLNSDFNHRCPIASPGMKYG